MQLQSSLAIIQSGIIDNVIRDSRPDGWVEVASGVGRGVLEGSGGGV